LNQVKHLFITPVLIGIIEKLEAAMDSFLNGKWITSGESVLNLKDILVKI
jgi:hypothetical protein